MLSYTYIIEYNLEFKTNKEKKRIYYSSNFELTDFVVTKKDIKQTEQTDVAKWKFLRHLIYGKILYNHSISECYTYGVNFKLEVKILNKYIHRHYANRFVSLYLEQKLYFISRGCFQLYYINESEHSAEHLLSKNKELVNKISSRHKYIDFEASINYILITIQNCILNKDKINALEFAINSISEIRDVLTIGDYEKIETIKETTETKENGKWILKLQVTHYVNCLIIAMKKIMSLFDLQVDKGDSFSLYYLHNIVIALNSQLISEVELLKTKNRLPNFIGDETILEKHYKNIRGNERYLFNYLNELYDVFDIGDTKKCKQKKLGGICAAIYESKVITHCNTFSECMRLLCAYWKREIPKDCRLNKYQESKQELLYKYRILNDIPQK